MNLSDLLETFIFAWLCLAHEVSFFTIGQARTPSEFSFGDQTRLLVTFPKTNMCQHFAGFLETRSHGKK